MLRYLIFAPVLLAVACSGSGTPRQAQINGATVYANNCNRCHEFRSPTEFTGPQWSIISTHMRLVGGMPADESRAVYEYLKSQHHPPYVPEGTEGASLPVDPDSGRTLVQERGCIGCHVVEGQGGKMGPSLDGISERRSEEFVVQQILDPKANKATSLMPNLGLTRADAQAIWAYLSSLDGGGGF